MKAITVTLRRLLAVAAVFVGPSLHATDYRASTPITPELARAALDPALMCSAIYRNCSVFGWNGPALEIGGWPLTDEPSGLDAGLYERTEDGRREVVLCFRGSTSRADWKANFEQALGDVPEQYHLALTAARTAGLYARENSAPESAHFSLAGHSLGGGLASFCGLFGRQRALCFATAPLGAGTQRQLRAIGEDRLKSAPQYVTHFFIRGDRVPESAQIFGAHFGTMVEPALEPPANFSGVQKEEDRAQSLLLAGLNLVRKRSPSPIAVARTALDAVARHSMENYIGALAAQLPKDGNGLDLIGVWKSQGSFFQASTNTAQFYLTANRRLVLRNELDILGERWRIEESGKWNFERGTLSFTVGGVAALEYELVGAAPDRAVQWRRSAIQPDAAGLQARFERAGRGDARQLAGSTALLIKGAFLLVKGKVVTWQREAASF